MSDLISKLNVLVRASLNSALSGSTHDTVSDPANDAGSPARRRLPPERIGKDIDHEIAELRKHIDDALNAEDRMQARLNDSYAQIDALDQAADNALLTGDELAARQSVQQMQRQRQQNAVLEADLESHRRATSELIERVNTLEAMVSDARSQQTQQPAAAQADDQASGTPGVVLSNLLRDARQRVDQAINVPATSAPTTSIPIGHTPAAVPVPAPLAPSNTVSSTPVPTTSVPIKVGTPTTPNTSSKDVDDDLARRRSRLSKPDGG